MKKIFWLSILMLSVFGTTYAQTNFNIGGGYFGQTITHPGVVLEFEVEKMYSQKASLPLRIDVGFYSHPRNHNGLFLDLNIGFRRYYKSGLFLEESIGIGILETILNSDGVYEVDKEGSVSETSRFNEPDFMPSVTIGIGYNLSKNSEKQSLIWFRPKIFWQYPHKTSSTFNPVIQFGFTKTLSVKK